MPSNNTLERVLFVNAADATVSTDAIIHLGNEDTWKTIGSQTAPEQSTTGSMDQHADRPDFEPGQQYLFIKSANAKISQDAIIHLGNEEGSKMAGKQIAFDDASNIEITGGFIGAACPSVVKQIAANHLRRQLAQNSAVMEQEVELMKLDLELKKLELAERRLQFERNQQNLTNQRSNATTGK